jgi:hypothetical protein
MASLILAIQCTIYSTNLGLSPFNETRMTSTHDLYLADIDSRPLTSRTSEIRLPTSVSLTTYQVNLLRG